MTHNYYKRPYCIEIICEFLILQCVPLIEENKESDVLIKHLKFIISLNEKYDIKEKFTYLDETLFNCIQYLFTDLNSPKKRHDNLKKQLPLLLIQLSFIIKKHQKFRNIYSYIRQYRREQLISHNENIDLKFAFNFFKLVNSIEKRRRMGNISLNSNKLKSNFDIYVFFILLHCDTRTICSKYEFFSSNIGRFQVL